MSRTGANLPAGAVGSGALPDLDERAHAGTPVRAAGAIVLVVDDNPLNCELFEAMLEPQGYRVVQAHSGAEALVQAEGIRPDLILLDVSMPGMDGFEVVRRLRANPLTHLVPVIMVTALDALDHRLRGLESGADDYLAKPVSQAELLTRVQTSLRLSYLRCQVDERQKLELVLGDVSDGIVIVDAVGRVREISPSARRWLGLERDADKLEALWGGLLGVPDDLQPAVARGEAQDFVVHRAEPPFFLRVSQRPVHDPQGVPTGAVFSLRDVTREKLEHLLQQDLFSLVSHKLRTPLTVMTSWTEVLLEGGCGPLAEQQREGMGAIAGAVKELRRVLDGILTHLEWTRRLQRLQRRTLSFTELARTMSERLGEQIEGEGKYSVEHSPQGALRVDAGLFVDSLLELVRNGLKFGATRVRIRMHVEAAGGRVVEVSDDGPGIPPEHLERIFERFFQVEKEFTGQVRGLGLGLPMVKQAVEAMGGSIEVRSQLQQGTRFILRF